MLNFIVKKAISEKTDNRRELDLLKRRVALRFRKTLPTNRELLQAYRRLIKNKSVKPSLILEKILQKRTVRTLSGIAAITVITKPFPCPGRCLYCPQKKNMPKSYLPNEPACMRAILNKFHPYRQVEMRLQALEANGHETDKIELIVLGGTWTAYPLRYRYWFIKECFRACNNTSPKINPPAGESKPQLKIPNLRKTLRNEQRKNETAKHRIVGLTLETRPDYVNIAEIKRMRELGCTRVELGAQSVYENILKYNRRGHSLARTIAATKLLKDAGLKINYHIMLNLPGSTPAKDLKMFDEIFNRPSFQPDLLKIYPCVVIKNSPLYKIWKKGDYRPYSDKQLAELLIAVKQKLPYYVRAVRIIRDIPKESIEAGSKISNLRQIIQGEMAKKNLECRCIRCREIKNQAQDKFIKLFRQDYAASGGQEIFLSFEDKNRRHLYALLRLRFPSQIFSGEKHFIPELKNAAIIRELHTYGQMAAIGEKSKVIQHRGLGKKLIAEAEKITRQNKIQKIAVISGVGVREYYKKLGYKPAGTYLVKGLK